MILTTLLLNDSCCDFWCRVNYYYSAAATSSSFPFRPSTHVNLFIAISPSPTHSGDNNIHFSFVQTKTPRDTNCCLAKSDALLATWIIFNGRDSGERRGCNRRRKALPISVPDTIETPNGQQIILFAFFRFTLPTNS